MTHAVKKKFPAIPSYILLLTIFSVALLIRIVCLIQIDASPLSFLSLDDVYYDNWALEISKGGILGKEVFYGLPLYPYILGFIYFIFGHALFTAKLINAIFSSISCVMLYLVGRNAFNKSTGLIAAAIFTFYNASLFHENILCSTSLATLLCLSMISLLFSINKKDALFKWAGLGLLAGITALANASVLLFVPFIIYWILIRFKGDSKKKLFTRISIMLISILSIITITAVRNYVVGKDFVPITSHSGITFYAGNNPLSNGAFRLPPELERDIPTTRMRSQVIAEEKLGRQLKPSEVSGFWFGEGIRFIKSDPMLYTKMFFKKIYLFWWTKEIQEVMSIKFLKQFSSVLRLPLFGFALISPLSILGLLLSFDRKRKDRILLYMFLSSVVISTALYFVNSRYRMIAEPVLILFAASALYILYNKLKEKRYAYLLTVSSSIILLFFALNIDVLHFTDISAHIQLGNSYEAKGELLNAEIAYKKALKIDPANPLIHFNLGVLYYERKELDLAVKEFEESIRLNPTFAKPYNNLAIMYEMTGQMKKSEKTYKQAIKANPLLVELYYNLGRFYMKYHRPNEGIDSLKAALRLYPTYVSAHNDIAYLYYLIGELDKAEDHLRISLKYDPDQENVKKNLDNLKTRFLPEQ